MIRAAIFDGPGKPFHIAELPAPRLNAGEALVRITLCTVCGSDLHTATGRRSGPTPCVLGHEPVGIVEQLGTELHDAAGEPIRVGDRIVWAVAVSCGTCFFCTHELPQKCEWLRKYGHEAHTANSGPLGGLASHSHLLSGTAVVKVPATIPDAVAAPAGCATATVMAAFRTMERCQTAIFTGGVIVVLGLGMLGLTACAVGATRGYTVIACDTDDSRLCLAKRFGAVATATPGQLRATVLERTDGRGAEAVLELSGSPAAAALSLQLVRIGGGVVWVGAVSPTPSVAVDPEAVVRKCLTIAGIHNYAPSDLAEAIAFLEQTHAHYPFAELVARTFTLDDVGAAFDAAEAERPIRVGVVA